MFPDGVWLIDGHNVDNSRRFDAFKLFFLFVSFLRRSKIRWAVYFRSIDVYTFETSPAGSVGN